MRYLLGVDIGTTSVKAIAYNEAGEMISKYAVGYEMQHAKPNYSEQNADEIFEAVVHSINRIIDTFLPDTPVFISFSSVLHSLIAVNEQGEPITNCIIWADNRAAEIAEQLRNTEEDRIFTTQPVFRSTPCRHCVNCYG